MAESRNGRDEAGARAKPHGAIQRSLSAFWQALFAPLLVVGLLLFSLFLSILIEWLGMTFIWAEEGVHHSRRMLETEITYLHADFRQNVFGSSPSQLALSAATAVYDWTTVKTGFAELHAQLRTPVTATESTLRGVLKNVYVRISDYVLAMFTLIQLFIVRILIVLLTLPAYIIVALAAVVDGLVQRDLRRYGGGREYGLVYHRVKPYLTPMVILPAFIYLSLPLAMHPNLIFVPAAMLFGLTIFITAATFKKYI